MAPISQHHRVCSGSREETEGFEEVLWLVLVWNNPAAKFLQRMCASLPRTINLV